MAIASLVPALNAHAVTVSWEVDSSGQWTTASNWSTGTLPGSSDDVVINRPSGTYTITIPSTGTRLVNSIVLDDNLTLSGTNSSTNVLAVATTAKISGTLTLGLGTLRGGTWTTTGTGSIRGSGTLDGVTLGGNLSSSGIVGAINGLTLANGTIAVPLFSFFNFSGPQTVGGTGTILASGGSINATNSALTIAPGITINLAIGGNITGSPTLTLGSSSVNQGTISSQNNAGSVTVTGTNWTNAGTVAAPDGGTLTLGGSWTSTGALIVGTGSTVSLTGSWSNSGPITVGTGGKLTLGGTFTPSSISALTNHGTVAIRGTLNNAGNTFILPGDNTISLASGTIGGGTVNASAGATAVGTLSGVIVGGNLASRFLAITNGLTLNGSTITLLDNFGTNPFLQFNGGAQTLGGTGTILLSANGSIHSTAALTIAPGVTVATRSISPVSYVNLGSSGTNQGTISSPTSVGSITVSGTNWTNTGTLSASNGGSLTLSGSWSNLGTIYVGTGSKLTLGGTFTPASIGTLTNHGAVAISGTIDNSGNSLGLADGTGNTFALPGGTIVGGTVTTAGASPVIATGTLSGVILAGNLIVPNGTLAVTNGLTLADGAITLSLTSTTSTLNFSGSSAQALGGTGTLLFGGTSSITGTGAVTIAPGITIATSSGSGSISLRSSSVNQGAISSRTSGKGISVTGTNWINAGTLSASNGGTLTIGGSWSNTGAVSIDSASTLILANATNPNGTINLSGVAIANYTGTSPATAVRQQLALGLLGTTGIILPEATADPARAIGYAEASLLLGLSGSKTAPWAGQTVDATTLLLKPTVFGDANLDGTVNADDYALLDKGFATNASVWSHGDFNYDGQVTDQDYLLIDTTLAKQQGGQLSPAFLSLRESQFGPRYVGALLTSIPEPSSAACLLAGTLLLKRRRDNAATR